MPEEQNRPVLLLLTSHWISMLGVALVTLAGCSWLFVLPAHINGHVENPYIGILIFLIIPAVFFAGLILMPIGLFLAKRRIAADMDTVQDRKTAWRQAGIFFLVTTIFNVIIASQLSYRAVEHMETAQFCGQSCHVMKPEFTAWHETQPHQSVVCVDCHVEPGVTGWVKSKMGGTRQLYNVVLNSYPRPIESGLESGRLAASAETCEQCHSRDRLIGARLRVSTKFKDDEANTASQTVLTMRVGGGQLGGIHGAHMGKGVHIRFAAADKKRQTIPWVEYRNTATGATRAYLASDAKADTVKVLPVFEMECADCHNRAAHSFEDPSRAMDRALASGQLPVDLPFLKKTGLELLKTSYSSTEEAGQKLPASLTSFYREKYPDLFAKRSNDIQSAAQALLAIYNRNVFPDLKVTWGTYPSNIGHDDSPGCFRCHDESHATPDKKTITQDCGACHELVSVDEASPAILKTLGIEHQAATVAQK